MLGDKTKAKIKISGKTPKEEISAENFQQFHALSNS